MDSSRAAWEIPSACAAIPILPAVKSHHCDLEPLAFLAKEIFLRDAAILQHHFGCERSADSHLVQVLSHNEPGGTAGNDERADSFGALGLVGHRKYYYHTCHRCI